MVQRLTERFKPGDHVEITFDQSVWLTAIVMRQDPPGIWVVTRDGKAWFVTNTRHIRTGSSES